MKIFSHNTMSYRTPTKWYLKPFYWLARCQNKDYKEQYKLGARLFDLRIRFAEDGSTQFGHGLFSYKGDDWIQIFEFCKDKGIYVRLHCEYARNIDDINTFIYICKIAESMGLYVFGGCVRNKYWQQVYSFKHYPIPFKDAYSSETAWCKWIPWLDDWFPWLYARFHNKETLDKYKDTDESVMIDFI